MTVPLYPLTPEHACAEIGAFALAVYRACAAADPGAPIVLMGDSAGGGLALSLAMQIREAGGLPSPAGLVLIAPWLDVTTADPSQARIEPRDVMLMRGMEWTRERERDGAAHGDDRHGFGRDRDGRGRYKNKSKRKKSKKKDGSRNRMDDWKVGLGVSDSDFICL